MNERRTTLRQAHGRPEHPSTMLGTSPEFIEGRSRGTTNDGFILLLTLIFMATLTVFTGALLYMTTYEMKNIGSQKDDLNLSGLADAGIDRAHREIRDDYLTTTQTGTSELRGGDYSLSTIPAGGNPDRIRYIDDSMATFTTETAILRAFDASYVNARIIGVVLWARASRGAGTGNNQLTVDYTVDGGLNYTAAISSGNLVNQIRNYSDNITADRTWSWATLMSPNFRVRAMRAGAGNRIVNLDALWLSITYSIDTLTEPWATGSYAVFPITLGSGTIESISITDEQGKIHLNYASQTLLENLLTNLSISSAATKAAAIVDYRGALLTNPFDSVEELKLVTGITADDYTAIKDYVTVYSYISPYVFRPPAYVAGSPGLRAPTNVNTASATVLKSVFDSSGLGGGDANTLADAVITRRNIAPFQGLYSYTAASNDYTYFYNFVQSQTAYLSATERSNVLDTADPSVIVTVSGATAFDCPTAELCYAGNTFHINVLARIGTRNFRVKTLRGNDGSHVFMTYIGDAALSGWRKENYE